MCVPHPLTSKRPVRFEPFNLFPCVTIVLLTSVLIFLHVISPIPCRGPKWANGHRFHIYDVFNNALVEMRRIPQSQCVFSQFLVEDPDMGEDCRTALKLAEDAFLRLESAVEQALSSILQRLASQLSPSSSSENAGGPTPSGSGSASTRRTLKSKTIDLDERTEHTIKKYLIFLRYRNNEQYLESVSCMGRKSSGSHPWMKLIPKGPLRRQAILRNFTMFLEHDLEQKFEPRHPILFADLEEQCWRPLREDRTELSVGIASEEQEFINTERCFGNLDDVDPYVLSSSRLQSYLDIVC